jgi:hypothetical protein
MTYPQQPGGWSDPNAAPQYPYGGPAGYPQQYGYATPPTARPNNSLAIAALVVSCVGVLGLCAYGLGGFIGTIGAILGHVARRQIRERGEGGDGMALAGVIVGWVATGLFVLALVGWAIFIWYVANNPEEFESAGAFIQTMMR